MPSVDAFAVSYPDPTGNVSGLMLGAYRVGEGRIVLNTLRILEHVGTQPAADRLLLNLVAYATVADTAPAAAAPRTAAAGGE